MRLIVRSTEDVIAAVPHMLGFKPQESLVVLPATPGQQLPVARIDLPRTLSEREDLLQQVSGPYERNAGPGAKVAIVCFTEDRRGAELASQHFATGLEKLGIAVPARLWATDDRWVEFNSGQAGIRSEATASRIAAMTVADGVQQPAPTREAIAQSMVGDRAPIAAILPTTRAAVETSTPRAEREWALDRLDRFHTDGDRLSDVDAARMLVALETIPTRDALWNDINRENTNSHIALWTDLTRRASDELRTPAASMLGFSSWLQGDGARAWCALDQIPPDGQKYAMAALVATAVQEGLPPSQWEANSQEIREFANVIDESFVPTPPRHGLGEPPTGPGGPSRGTPSR